MRGNGVCGVVYEQLPLCNMRESTKHFACNFVLYVCDSLVHAVAYLVEAPCYKPEDRGFDSR
jgi:hypothetical protein